MLARSGERGEPCGVPSSGNVHSILHDARTKIGTKELEHLLIRDPVGHSSHEGVVVHPVEECFQVEIDHPGVTACDGVLSPAHRLMGRAPGAKAVALVGEVGVEEGTEHLEKGLLDKTVQNRWHPETSYLPARLGNEDPADG